MFRKTNKKVPNYFYSVFETAFEWITLLQWKFHWTTKSQQELLFVGTDTATKSVRRKVVCKNNCREFLFNHYFPLSV